MSTPNTMFGAALLLALGLGSLVRLAGAADCQPQETYFCSVQDYQTAASYICTDGYSQYTYYCGEDNTLNPLGPTYYWIDVEYQGSGDRSECWVSLKSLRIDTPRVSLIILASERF
jgi:hypothetical protein